jgi:membrane protein DedA with SNARE-associated domain
MDILAIPQLADLSYGGMVFLLFGSAFFLPVPEELTLIAAGYLVAEGVLDFWVAVPLAILSMAAGDAALFFLAKVGSPFAAKLRTRINKLGLEKTWLFAPSHPLRAVFLLRFVSGLRFIAPVYAGFEQASWRGFLVAVFGNLVIYVPLMLLAAGYFSKDILAYTAEFEIVRHAVFALILAAVGVGILAQASRFLRRKPPSP